MRRYLLDTGPAQDFIHKREPVYTRANELLADGDKLGVGMPVVGELFAGVEYSSTRERNYTILIRRLHSLLLWPFDRDAAEEYGRLFALLRRNGRIMQQIDMQIAAIALTLGNCTVVTKDSDFTAIPGLTIENWS
jgi:tRNA(fMet)-specific endonuclease VapC